MITGDQILVHLFGDFIFQSHWMATNKAKSTWACFVHVAFYSIGFMFLRPSALAMLVIVGSHFLIDRFGLARYVVWAKNQIGPRIKWFYYVNENGGETVWNENYPPAAWKTFNLLVSEYTGMTPWFKACPFGYHPNVPFSLAVWLLIVADNALHLLCNGLALRYL